MPFIFGRRSGIAVVEIHGVIGTRVRESVYARLFDSIARDKRYKALLLDINSPGGSATGSDLLYHSLKKVAQQKPVVAYVSGVGASGGYYLACAASKVVALPAALVGSIGVIYLRPILEQLLGKVGVELSVFKGGRLKDMTGFWRSPTDEESEKFQGLISEMYDTFVSVVVQGRSLEDSQVRELATGELYTARRGHEMGLVDELGDFELALNLAAELGNVKAKPRWIRPKRSLSERLTGRMSSRSPGLGLLSAEMLRLLAGGMYYVEPSLMLGEYSETG
ncbi:MAG: signal peptide peptidase SppA [Chloroflexi bacterium]|nr:signal peptide peptidase SppA [Chloroflexota bacterium]MDA1220167.1 signal peptide peptidase SppA [Chloroflexota bacterium]